MKRLIERFFKLTMGGWLVLAVVLFWWLIGSTVYNALKPETPPQIESTPRKVAVQTLDDDADRVRYLQIWMVRIDGEERYFGEFIDGGESKWAEN
ncbi:hypothetical protein HMPREF2626_01500 [Aerococcus sp. HMSC062A02]|uniref:hypothetical protein n=1 Tax=Aerococcus sp. HMSC062A02 TaxID=1715105 RepID=UPI0008A29EDB|nr:hypothetical protein [Aerococcus sp. HMSC062A02]OFN02613.1 hypothetical protein HMPREF2626_01500 [Aerococcus sp. HMSC062A02]